MRTLACAWLLIAALSLPWPALGQEAAADADADADAGPAGESGGEEETGAGAADEGERPRARGLREKPVWEIGVVGGGGWLPDYPAADENHVQGIALPFAIYRGDFLRVGDGGGPRGLFVDIPWLELNVGLDASFPVDSSDNDAREGMDDLDYLLEAGPKLIVKLRYDDPANDLDLSLAARGVISTDFANVRYEGITLSPAVTYRRTTSSASICGPSPRSARPSASTASTTTSTRCGETTCGPAARATARTRATSAASSPSACRGASASGCGCSVEPRSASGKVRPTRTARCSSRT